MVLSSGTRGVDAVRRVYVSRSSDPMVGGLNLSIILQSAEVATRDDQIVVLVG